MQRSLFLTLALSLLLSAAAAHAQVDLEATIPFDFQVGEKVLPAGSYQITTNANTGQVLVRGRSNGEAATIGSFGVGGGPFRGHKSKLLFNRYDSSYFLKEMWREDSSTGRAIRQSRSERQMAQNAPPQPVTLVLARR